MPLPLCVASSRRFPSLLLSCPHPSSSWAGPRPAQPRSLSLVYELVFSHLSRVVFNWSRVFAFYDFCLPLYSFFSSFFFVVSFFSFCLGHYKLCRCFDFYTLMFPPGQSDLLSFVVIMLNFVFDHNYSAWAIRVCVCVVYPLTLTHFGFSLESVFGSSRTRNWHWLIFRSIPAAFGTRKQL